MESAQPCNQPRYAPLDGSHIGSANVLELTGQGARSRSSRRTDAVLQFEACAACSERKSPHPPPPPPPVHPSCSGKLNAVAPGLSEHLTLGETSWVDWRSPFTKECGCADLSCTRDTTLRRSTATTSTNAETSSDLGSVSPGILRRARGSPELLVPAEVATTGLVLSRG